MERQKVLLAVRQVTWLHTACLLSLVVSLSPVVRFSTTLLQATINEGGVSACVVVAAESAVAREAAGSNFHGEWRSVGSCGR